MVWTPCANASGSSEIGPYSVQAVRDCAITGQSLPLVVISHGYGGSLLGHHDTATTLADAGFVVATLNHPGDFYGDDSGAHELSIFESRPRDVSRVISFMLESWQKREKLDPGAIGVMGFSRGGTTALILSGAVPSVPASTERFCRHWWSFVDWQCRRLKTGGARIAPNTDSRIGAAVVMDPLNLFDTPGLESVRTPVQLWASENGGDGVELQHVEEARAALPQLTDYQIARGAGHFAYLTPCPPGLEESAPRICEDPEGFDRVSWHGRMNTAVVEFFKRKL
ncbi:alpha/beta hydrolase family protein [Microbulbifer halophilus]